MCGYVCFCDRCKFTSSYHLPVTGVPLFNAYFKFHFELSGKAEHWQKRKVSIWLRWTNCCIDKTRLQRKSNGNWLTDYHHSSSAPLMRPKIAAATNITSAKCHVGNMVEIHHVSYMVLDLRFEWCSFHHIILLHPLILQWFSGIFAYSSGLNLNFLLKILAGFGNKHGLWMKIWPKYK